MQKSGMADHDPLNVSSHPQITKLWFTEMAFTTDRDVSKRTLDHKNRIHFLFTTNRDVPITFWSQKSGPFFGPRPRFRWFKIVHFCLKIYMVNENNPMGYPMLSLLKKRAMCFSLRYLSRIKITGKFFRTTVFYRRWIAPDLLVQNGTRKVNQMGLYYL